MDKYEKYDINSKKRIVKEKENDRQKERYRGKERIYNIFDFNFR